jgi:hypothetical protein
VTGKTLSHLYLEFHTMEAAVQLLEAKARSASQCRDSSGVYEIGELCMSSNAALLSDLLPCTTYDLSKEAAGSRVRGPSAWIHERPFVEPIDIVDGFVNLARLTPNSCKTNERPFTSLASMYVVLELDCQIYWETSSLSAALSR